MNDFPLMVRRATVMDIVELRAMQALSARRLCVPSYTAQQVESFIAHGTMDDVLVHDGTYYLAEVTGRIVGSAGWSTRVPGYDAHGLAIALPAGARPRVRSVFVHPDWARRGIASRMMGVAEGAARAAGHREIELDATLSGLALYRALGYAELPARNLRMRDGTELAVVPMTKLLMRAAA